MAVAVLVVAALGWAALHDRAAPPSGGKQVATATQFPPVDRASLTPLQVRVLDIVEQQWHTQPVATTFTEGADEPWCADFVSWVMREAGVALDNPNGGSWRIPGVYTMQEYYQGAGRLQPAGYRPRIGDVVLWGPDSPMGLHANIVVTTDGSSVTTVGGNEGGITLRRSEIGADTGLLGFGTLP